MTPLSLGLTLAGLLGAVLALYLLKHEQRKLVVPSVLVWDNLLTRRRGALWARKLRRLLSLLLALVIAALLTVAISDPRRLSKSSDRRLVILIDASASMQARDTGQTRLEAARQLARGLVGALGGTDRALVAQLDASVTPMSTLTEDRATLQHAIGRVVATDLAGDLASGVAFALNVLKHSAHADLFILSDGNLSGIDAAEALLSPHKRVRVHYLRVGKSGRNVGIEDFSVRRYPLDKTRTESIVRVHNYGNQTETVTLKLLAGDALLYEEQLTLAGDATAARTFADLSASADWLEARIALAGTPDPLSADDRAYAALPARKQSRVLLVTEGNRYLEAALLLDEYLEVDELTPAAYTGAQGHDVVIFDHVLPKTAPDVPALYLAPSPDPLGFAPFKTRGELERPFFERVDDDHPLARQLSLRDINIGRALALVAEPSDRIIAQTARGNPLLVEGVRNGARFVALAFDLRESDLPLRVSFPLFVLATVDSLAGEQPSDAARGAVGEPWRVMVPDGVNAATLRGPAGDVTRVPVREREVRLQVTRAGIYRLEAGPMRALLAANVPADLEGTIAPRAELLVKPGPSGEGAGTGFLASRVWPWLAALSALLLCLEWLSFHRRWTV